MDRREIKISRWITIVSAVFCAEDKIKDQWVERLAAAKNMPQDERTKVANEYLRAIATEIIDNS